MRGVAHSATPRLWHHLKLKSKRPKPHWRTTTNTWSSSDTCMKVRREACWLDPVAVAVATLRAFEFELHVRELSIPDTLLYQNPVGIGVAPRRPCCRKAPKRRVQGTYAL